MKIKAIPIKKPTLCQKCRFSDDECSKMKCDNCGLNSFKKGVLCICLCIKDGERCEHFQSNLTTF